MLENKRAKDLTEQELSKIPLFPFTISPNEKDATITLTFKAADGEEEKYDLSVYRYLIYKLFPGLEWGDILELAKRQTAETIPKELPMRIFVGKTTDPKNYKQRYWRFELIIPSTRNVIAEFFPERVIEFLTKHKKEFEQYIILKDGQYY